MLRLPHREVTHLIDSIKRDVIRREDIVLANIPISYSVFRTESDTPDLSFYDEHGTIFIPESLLNFNEHFAHLIALHEHVEIEHKRAGRPHAYAHRRALLVEFLAAKQHFTEVLQLTDYLQWRIEGYPEWKSLDRATIVSQLVQSLAVERPRRGTLFQLIKEHAL